MNDHNVLMDKLAVTEALMRYCRGVDRKDRETFESAYWPDATDDHVKYVGGVPVSLNTFLPRFRECERST